MHTHTKLQLFIYIIIVSLTKLQLFIYIIIVSLTKLQLFIYIIIVSLTKLQLFIYIIIVSLKIVPPLLINKLIQNDDDQIDHGHMGVTIKGRVRYCVHYSRRSTAERK